MQRPEAGAVFLKETARRLRCCIRVSDRGGSEGQGHGNGGEPDFSS